MQDHDVSFVTDGLAIKYLDNMVKQIGKLRLSGQLRGEGGLQSLLPSIDPNLIDLLQ